MPSGQLGIKKVCNKKQSLPRIEGTNGEASAAYFESVSKSADEIFEVCMSQEVNNLLYLINKTSNSTSKPSTVSLGLRVIS